MADPVADVGPLVWRRIRAGQYEADAGRFGRYVIERRNNGRWYACAPRVSALTTGNRSLRMAQARAGRYLAFYVAADPRTLLEWGVGILYREYEANASDLYEQVICRADYPLWFVAAGCDRFSPTDSAPPAGPACLALRRIWDAAGDFPVMKATPQLVALARDCLADPSLLGVLADAAQDAGNSVLEEAARTIAGAIESLRSSRV